MPALTLALAIFSLLSVPQTPAKAPAAAPTHVMRKLAVGGEGGWDYVTMDSVGKRLYVPRSTRVLVLGLDGKSLGEIKGTEGVHGVALAPDLDKGFTSNGRSNTITIFKLSTLEVLAQVKATGENPDAILYDAATQRVFSFNGRGKNATVLDAVKGEVVGTIPFGHKPEFAAADGKGRVYVNLEDSNELAVIDAKKMTVEKLISLAPLEEPSGLAMDVAHRRLFAVGRNKLLAVIDPGKGKVITTLPIGEGADGAAFDAGKGLVYSSNGEGTLTVIHEDSPDTYKVMEQAPTQKGARTMALDEATHLLYLPTAEYGPTPAATADKPRPRPSMIPDSFQILVVGN